MLVRSPSGHLVPPQPVDVTSLRESIADPVMPAAAKLVDPSKVMSERCDRMAGPVAGIGAETIGAFSSSYSSCEIAALDAVRPATHWDLPQPLDPGHPLHLQCG